MLSVIIPVYKVETYLRGCVESVLAQENVSEELEILLVDDGSPDGCGRLCDELAASHPQIRVIHKENGGLSDARNAGLAAAKGDWISFLDGDDALAPSYFSVLLSLLRENPEADMAAVSFVNWPEGETPHARRETKRFLLTREEAMKALCYNRELNNSAWGKVYRRSLFEGISFPKGRLYEDLATIYRLTARTKAVAVSDAGLYYYLQRGESILHSSFSVRHLDSLWFSREALAFYQKEFPGLSKDAGYRVCAAAFEVLLKADPAEASLKEGRDAAWKDILKYRGCCLQNKDAGLDYRLLSVASFLGPWFTRWLWNLWLKI